LAFLIAADLSEDVKFAFTKGRIEGASGKGNIFVRGAGDLGNNVNANYDPISSQLGVINVGSVDHTGIIQHSVSRRLAGI
tara:strand:- start:1737 stop:1976 length:240 start_codon:yes stop_codon:yes gene_type:complete